MNINGNLFQFDTPKIMGIINLSPDSFYENDAAQKETLLLKKVDQFIENGADIIDLGGSSTRPGSDLPSPEEELKRILKPLQAIRKKYPKIPISIDTVRAEIAEKALENGADLINDVSGGVESKKMVSVLKKYNCPYILTHNLQETINKGVMEDSKNTIKELIQFFSKKISEMNQMGVHDIIIDPGFGFSKSIAQNFQIVKDFEMLHVLDSPILVGVSRKSMVYKTLNINTQDALNGSSVMHAFLISKKASIFRVHDVKEMNQVKKLWESSFS